MPSKLRNINKLAINKQLALPLKFKSIKNRENYLVSKSNIKAVKLIEKFKFWQNRKKTNSIPGAIIYGPKGSGKTHLSSILKQKIDCVYLTSLSNNYLEQVTEGKNFILDDFKPGKDFPSKLVMHFINQVTYKEGSILLLSRLSPFQMEWDLDDLNSRISPTRVTFPDGVCIVDVGCGTRFNVCVTTSGRVLSWGVGTLGQLGHDQKRRQRAPKEIEGLSNIVKVSCGQDHAMVLNGDGIIYSWGHAEYGCLGRKPKTGNTVPGVVPLELPVSDISCGSKHNAVIVNDGRVFTWGLAGDGRLGLGLTRDKPFYETPQEVNSTIMSECGGAKSISCGHKHTACTTNNGKEILVWGCADDSRLGVAVFSKESTKNQNLVCYEPTKASIA